MATRIPARSAPAAASPAKKPRTLAAAAPAADESAPVPAFQSVGPRIKALRRLRNMTVEELADAVGVHKAHVSRLERGLKTPSIHMLARLAKALGTSMGNLVGETLDKADIKITRGAELAPGYAAEEPAAHRFAPLLHGSSVSAFEAFIVYPGQSGGSLQAQHEGQEMLYVLAGTIDVIFPERTERLQTGDCIHFPGYLNHRIARVGRAQARALLVLSAQ
ncbi:MULTISPECIES: XRE family transcriptional regulator [unclassified Variovorax]|uniref:helix-turn-helix domain-containing protein n=1 Tax=unclassified Variovorax TaxID=663243 RepID=UPI000CC754EE|nr:MULTISPECIES: XRE family transcriptional regulator [unclassified Variovorax]PNG51627.1 HTH-type transcriptional regulator SinR [Variovorax sp. B2]PNG54347.1 HTH-type transcriptional regulator SinR [Variovorax sp. B4]VTV11842.1 HTH-type transcriptional regulator SinR [Variovorax sp. WDL1]